MDRRRFLGLAGVALVCTPALARLGAGSAGEELESIDLDLSGSALDGGAIGARRARLVLPRQREPAASRASMRLPVLVLLHGLAETASEALGIRAWSERYGLLGAHARLRRPPVGRALDGAPAHLRYLSPARAAAIDAELAREPLRPMLMICPYMPDLRRSAGAGALDAYADWIDGVLLPAVRARVPAAATSAAATALAGCSLGGYVGLEVFRRKVASFGVFAGVQSALGAGSVAGQARALERAVAAAGSRRVLLETSSGDPFRGANEALSAELRRLGIPHDLRVLPGPHDQPWLREVGTLELLLWLDRAVEHAPA